MKTMMLAVTLFLIGCGTGKKTAERMTEGGTATGGVTALLAEDPEKLRETVMGLIGEGPDAEPALEIIDRYEADLGFVMGERSTSATIADSATSSFVPPGEMNAVDRPRGLTPVKTDVSGKNTPASDRIRSFTRSSLSVAIIGLNECHRNFMETGDDRFARRGLAHGYLALISDPSPTQEAQVLEKMEVLQTPLLKR
jgi:hypothetical protein